MWDSLYLSEDQNQSGDCANYWLRAFGLVDPYAEAKAFYGEEVFKRLYEHEQDQRRWESVKRTVSQSGRLIDDVAGQLHNP